MMPQAAGNASASAPTAGSGIRRSPSRGIAGIGPFPGVAPGPGGGPTRHLADGVSFPAARVVTEVRGLPHPPDLGYASPHVRTQP